MVNISLGALGESIAARHLIRRGYRLIQRNYRKPWGEIDLILEKGNTTHFFEVKTVSSSNYSISPVENLHPKKVKRLQRVVQSYLSEKRLQGQWQIDAALIVVDLHAKKAELEVLENISI